MKTWKKIGAALFTVVILSTLFLPAIASAQNQPQESALQRAQRYGRYFQYVTSPSTALVDGGVAAYNYAQESGGNFSCNFASAATGQFSWEGCVAGLMQSIFLKGAAWVLWASALFFDLTLDASLNFKNIVDGIPIVNVGWGIFRDIANLFFIFVLLLSAIGIILDNSKFGSKAAVPAVIVAALLINFSLFFTQVIIDTSNIAALQFYGQLRGNPSVTPGQANTSLNPGVAAAFVNALDLSTIFKAGSDSGSLSAGQIAGQANQQGMSIWNVIIVSVGGGILILITAVVFFIGALMFMYRSVVLIFLLTTSPIAFLGSAIPSKQLSAQSAKWWSMLTKQAIFAPMYMALTYIVVKALIMAPSNPNGGNFAALFKGDASAIGTAFSFFMVIFFMVGILIFAASSGAAGAGLAGSAVKKLKSWGLGSISGIGRGARGAAGMALRNTAGWGATQLADSNALRGYVARRGLGSQLIKNTADKVSGAKFGLSKSFSDQVKDKVKQEEKMFTFATGSKISKRQAYDETDVEYKKRLAEEKAFKEDSATRGEDFATRLAKSKEFTVASLQGASAALQSKTISKRADASKIKKDAVDIQLSQIQALAKVIGDKHTFDVKKEDGSTESRTIDLKNITADDLASKITVENLRALKEAHDNRPEEKLDGDLRKLTDEISRVSTQLDNIKYGKAGERQRLTVELTDLKARRAQAEQKKDNLFDKTISTVQRTGETGVESKLDALIKQGAK